MTLSDRRMPGKAGVNTNTEAINEIIWTPNRNGSVRQHWRTSTDSGHTWKMAFDGRCIRSSRPQPASANTVPDAPNG